MIITGCSKWTLYEHSHFNGQSACWQPRDNCAPAFFRDEKLMKGWAQKVSSVRRGCYSDKTFYGEPLLFERSADNSTIGSGGHVFGNWYTIQCFWTSPFSDWIIWFTLWLVTLFHVNIFLFDRWRNTVIKWNRYCKWKHNKIDDFDSKYR